MSPALSDLPVRKVTRALESAGFEHTRTKGSHAVYRHQNGRAVVVPLHGTVKRGTLASILRQAGLTNADHLLSVVSAMGWGRNGGSAHHQVRTVPIAGLTYRHCGSVLAGAAPPSHGSRCGPPTPGTGRAGAVEAELALPRW